MFYCCEDKMPRASILRPLGFFPEEQQREYKEVIYMYKENRFFIEIVATVKTLQYAAHDSFECLSDFRVISH